MQILLSVTVHQSRYLLVLKSQGRGKELYLIHQDYLDMRLLK
jgi:hypothetical protein